MNCIVPANNIKVLARSIQALAKIGNELFIEAHPEKLTFITFNQCKTVCAKSNFLDSFFSHYNVTNVKNAGENELVSCRIHIKTLLPVFKGTQFEKKLDYIKIEYVNDSDLINFKVKYKTDDILLNHTLRLMDPEIFQMQNKINRGGGSHICATSSFYNQLLAMFGITDDDITLEVTKQKVIARNYCIGAPVRSKSVRSQVNLNASEFSIFSIQTESIINFSLKPLRTLIQFAEAFNLQISFNFEQGGKPLLMTVSNPTFEGEFIVSTLNPYSDANSSITTASLATKITQVSTNGLHNLTTDDIAALAAIANENWEDSFSEDEETHVKNDKKKAKNVCEKEESEKNNKKIEIQNSKSKEKEHTNTKNHTKHKENDYDMDLDVIPNSPESPRSKKLKYIFKRSYEPTFHPAMMDQDNLPMVPDSDSE